MKDKYIWLSMSLAVFCLPSLVAQRTPEGTSAERTVPRVVHFSGTLSDGAGTAPNSLAGVTFALYKEQQGGVPLWQETQNVQLDVNGNYTVLLGASKSEGVSAELFVSNEARWLGVQPAGQAEQPRVLLLSVPYALKAADAETVGGLPPSAFVLAAPPGASGNAVSSAANLQPAVTPALAGSGTLDFIPLWTPDGSTLGNSILFQSASSQIGVGTTTPSAKLDVFGSAKVRGTLLLPAAGSATATAGKNSQPLNLAASAFNSGTATAVNQTFSWRAEPVGNDTASASGSLNLLFGVGTSAPTETGLQIGSGGLFTFAPGQTFPGAGTITGVTAGTGLAGGGTTGNVNLSLLTSCGVNQVLQWSGSAWVCGNVGTGNGTITGVTAGTDLTGGGTTGNVTLNLDTTKVPQLNAANTFNASQTINGSLLGQTASFQGSNSGSIVQVTQNSSTSGAALAGVAGGSTGIGLQGTGFTGVSGFGLTNGTGVAGTGGNAGVSGTTSSTFSGAAGVNGQAPASSGGAAGVIGESASGIGVFGASNATSGVTYGVQGINHNTTKFAAGVEGESFATTGVTFGLVGSVSSPNGIGAVALGDGESSIGLGLIGCCPVGVWGDTGSSAGGAAGLVGTAGDARAIYLENNSPSGVPTAFMQQDASGKFALVAGGATGSCTVDTNGNLACHGSKSAVVPVDNGQRQVALYAVEAPQNWFEDFGSGRLENGRATISLDPTFAQTVNTADYHVFLTPRADCEGLYVASTTETGFEVRELHSGQSQVAFDYRIVALRRGYESVRLKDMTEAMAKARENVPVPLAKPGPQLTPHVPPKLLALPAKPSVPVSK